MSDPGLFPMTGDKEIEIIPRVDAAHIIALVRQGWRLTDDLAGTHYEWWAVLLWRKAP